MIFMGFEGIEAGYYCFFMFSCLPDWLDNHENSCSKIQTSHLKRRVLVTLCLRLRKFKISTLKKIVLSQLNVPILKFLGILDSKCGIK